MRQKRLAFRAAVVVVGITDPERPQHYTIWLLVIANFDRCRMRLSIIAYGAEIDRASSRVCRSQVLLKIAQRFNAGEIGSLNN